MKRWRFLLPLGATAAIACNLGGFWMGGPRQWWELAVSIGYLAVWGWFLTTGPEGWQRVVSRIWWLATAVCAAVCFVVVTWKLDGFLVILLALGVMTPLSGLAVLTGGSYPLFYGVCTLLAAGYGTLSLKKR